MVRPALRSRSLRKVTRKIPGGRSVIQYKSKRPKKGACATTGQALKGAASKKASALKSSSRSSKRPSRPFGGKLSASAARVIMKNRARSSQ